MKKKTKIIIGVLSVVLIFVLVKGIGSSKAGKKDNNILTVKDEREVRTEKIDALLEEDTFDRMEGEKYFKFRGQVCSWNGEKLNLYINTDRNKKLALSLENPIIRPGNKTLYIASPDQGLIYFLDEDGQVREKHKEVLSMYNMKVVGDYLVYHGKNDEVNETVGILDEKAKYVMKYPYGDEKVTAFTYEPSKSKTAIAVLTKKADEFGSRLDIYDRKNKKESIFFKDEVIMDLEMSKLENTVVLTESNLYYLSGIEIVWQLPVERVKDFQVKGNELYLYSGSSIKEIDTKGNIKEEYKIDDNYSKFIMDEKAFKDNIIFYDNKKIAIYKNRELILKEDKNIDTVFLIDDKIYIGESSRLGVYKIGKMEVEVEDE